MDPLKIALLGIVVAASQLSPNDFPGSAYSQDKNRDTKSSAGTTKKIDPKIAEKLRQVRIEETRKKYPTSAPSSKASTKSSISEHQKRMYSIKSAPSKTNFAT